MKRIRVAGCALIIIAGILCGCARSPEARRDQFLAKGKEFMEKREFSRALLEFRNAAKVMPKDAEAWYQTGMAALALGQLQTAFEAFNNAVHVDPTHANAKLRLAQLMTSGDQPVVKEAEKAVRELMDAAPASPEMLNTLAIAELRLGKTEDAVRTLGQLLAGSPGELRASLLLARVKLVNNDVKGAEEVLKKACESSPKAIEPQIALGRFYMSRNRASEAEQALQRALQLNPASGAALRDLAVLQNWSGRKKEAEDNFKRASGAGQEYKPIYALFLFSEGRREEAVREFERLAREEPGNRAARTRLVTAYQAVNRAADANKIIDEALQKNSRDLEALIQKAQLLAAARNYAEAEENLNKVVQLRPDSAEVHYLMAKLHQARGTAQQYRQSLFKALELDPYFLTARLELAGALIAGKSAQAALDVLDQTPESERQSLAVLTQRNWALWAAGRLPEMRKGIDRGLAASRSTELLVQDGLWKLRSGNPTGARGSLEEALNINPGDMRALAGLKHAYLMQRQPGMAVQKVKEYASQQPKSASVQQFLGYMLWAVGDRAAARAAFQTAKAADPQSRHSDLALVQLDAMDSKWDDAAGRLKTLVASQPADATAHLWLGNVEMVRKNPAAALEHFRRAVEAAPGHAQSLNNFAYLLSEHANKPDEALKHAEKALELDPDHPVYAGTLGWILYRKGLYPSAVKYLERAASAAKDPVIKYHLAMAYAKNGARQQGQAVFADALKRNPDLPEATIAREVLASAK